MVAVLVVIFWVGVDVVAVTGGVVGGGGGDGGQIGQGL